MLRKNNPNMSESETQSIDKQCITYMEQYNDIYMEAIPASHVCAYNKKYYNSNNHWTNEIKPVDYHDKIAECNLTEWVNWFRTDYKILELPMANWIREANKFGQHTGMLSLLYFNELNDYCAKYETDSKYTELFTQEALEKAGGGYFVRSNSVSLKNGIHGTGPYRNIRKILESLITCNAGHNPFADFPVGCQYITFNLFPWIDIKDEYRIFVHNRKITAISQQDLGTPHMTMAMTDNPFEYCHDVTNKIKDEFYTNIIPWMEHKSLNDIVIDMALISKGNTTCTDTGDLTTYTIEFNPFGAEYASGSGLFHWELNHDKLYSGNDSNNQIYFRYTCV